MSGKGWCVDKRIKRTVAYLLGCPRSTVPEAMRACKISDKESSNLGKQMAVRRARKKAAAGKRIALPPNLPISQFDSLAYSCVNCVPDDHCSHRQHVDQFTPVDANNAGQYALNTLVFHLGWKY